MLKCQKNINGIALVASVVGMVGVYTHTTTLGSYDI